MLADAARAYPWGLGDSPFWAFAAGHPGNNAATIAAYWAARTEALIEFETAHPGSCLRVRHEDLAADRERQAGPIYAALGLDARELAVLREPEPAAETPVTPADAGPPVPSDRLPPRLLARIRDLQSALGYDP